ncbi:tRNA (adenosine(37)-N6)-threonylcarbamoyltransferase complex ATPase subunit type 1 TsaE [Parasphingorhabdus sp.]|uniref:tRNA (adenosine(37)-N6)-threonylcarbamoyltransferase complex ATPase subunit type 1 TsaE n=1 Tax=Parasphingorhabdus sp. TaxID=2709688 RepID=UPI003BAE3EF4
MTLPIILENEAATMQLGQQLADLLLPGDKVSLTGTLGAGKTALARGVLRGLGFEDDVPSPTFAIVQQYDPPEVRMPVAHVDFYRIEDADEIQELGLYDVLIDGALIAEWPDRLPEKFWADALQITLEIVNENKRRLTWTAGPAWKDRWPIT